MEECFRGQSVSLGPWKVLEMVVVTAWQRECI